MNLRNAGIYLGILVLVVGFGLMLQQTILKLQDSSHVTFSDESVEYINRLYASYDDNNFVNVTSKTDNELQEDKLFLSDDETSGTTSITDVLAQLNFFKQLNQKFIQPFKFAYNVPTFLLSLFGLELEPFKLMTGIINLVIYISLILLIIKELK